MRRGVWLLVLAVGAAVLGVASARADGMGTTTSTTTSTTTTATTAPSFASLAPSSLPAGCVGAGAAAFVLPAHPVIALGTPAAELGPSAYSTSSGSVLSFDSSNASGSTCASEEVSLSAVSLFGGVVTANSVQATDSKGTATGLEINGSAVTATAGQRLPVDDWGELTLGATTGRVTAPLVLRLLQAHDSLPAGTAVALAFAASAQPVAKPKHHRQTHTDQKQATSSSGQRKHSAGTHHPRKHRRRQPQKPPPDYPPSTFPFLLGGGLTEAAEHNPVVSTAMQYLGVRYLWGGASPKTGFDCSGLVKYVFAQLGVSLPHYAAAQWHSPAGVWVAPNQLEPGDLVFFTGTDGTRKVPGHVGIYVGDVYLIDAPHTGAFVRIDSLNERWFANKYVGARRITSHPLVARHLLHVTKARAPTTANPLAFPAPITVSPLGESFGTAAAATGAVRTASRGYWMWAGPVLGGLFFLLFAGGLLVRHRHPAEAGSSSEAST